jgi:hypothetical protein
MTHAAVAAGECAHPAVRSRYHLADHLYYGSLAMKMVRLEEVLCGYEERHQVLSGR